jgi:hypothetical protein
MIKSCAMIISKTNIYDSVEIEEFRSYSRPRVRKINEQKRYIRDGYLISNV